LAYIDIADYKLKLPALITSIDLDHVTVQGGVSLKNCTGLKEFKLKHVYIGDHILHLPASTTNINLDDVTLVGGKLCND